MKKQVAKQEANMVAVRLSATIGADRKLVIQLPDEIPAGNIEIEIRAVVQPSSMPNTVEAQAAEPATDARQPDEIPYNPAREAARAKLRAAG